MEKIELYDIFEKKIKEVNFSKIVDYDATFTNGEAEYKVNAFWNGNDEYKVRFMPKETGSWSYEINLNEKKIKGEFLCVDNEKNHGQVKVINKKFKYENGQRYLPFGTTCYAWIHQENELQEKTLETLKKSPFNKVRMCIFPKSMPYNNNEPDLFPFHKTNDDKWDVEKPNELFWEHLEKRIRQLDDIDVEADLILFHPYDRWGFSEFPHKDDLKYLKYCITRLSSFSNVWWSLANEYDLVPGKTQEDWDDFGDTIAKLDVYDHLISNHNCLPIYPKRKWMTHCSIQSGDLDRIVKWRKDYDMPVIIDECGYEGDIEYPWGNLSAFEMTHRIWKSVTKGGYCTHGETFHREDEVLWWAKGGTLYGKSPSRIKFLKDLLESIPEDLSFQQSKIGEILNMDPNDIEEKKEDANINIFFQALMKLDEKERERRILEFMPNMLKSKTYRLQYLGKTCPSFINLELSEKENYRVEVIDIWEMTRKTAKKSVSGKVKIDLPGKEGIALLITKND